MFTVEIEANGDPRSTYESSPSLVGSLSSLCWYKRFLSCLCCSSRPSTIFYKFSLLYTLLVQYRSLYLSSSPSKLGKQSCRVTCLLICVSGYNNEDIGQDRSKTVLKSYSQTVLWNFQFQNKIICVKFLRSYCVVFWVNNAHLWEKVAGGRSWYL